MVDKESNVASDLATDAEVAPGFVTTSMGETMRCVAEDADGAPRFVAASRDETTRCVMISRGRC